MKSLNKYIVILVSTSLFLVGCASLESSVEQNTSSVNETLSKDNKKWVLSELYSKELQANYQNPKEASLSFKDSLFHGYTGCNSIRGKYSEDSKSLKFSEKGMLMTRMFCKGSSEREFVSALKEVRTYQISDGVLHFFNEKNKEIASFKH